MNPRDISRDICIDDPNKVPPFILGKNAKYSAGEDRSTFSIISPIYRVYTDVGTLSVNGLSDDVQKISTAVCYDAIQAIGTLSSAIYTHLVGLTIERRSIASSNDCA